MVLPFHILPASETDLVRLQRLHAELFATSWAIETWTAYLAEPANVLRIVKCSENAGVVGFAVARGVLDEAEVLSLGVAPACRHQGLASQLMRSVLEALSTRGITRVFLEVGETNGRARDLYESFGFEQIGLREAYYESRSGSGDCSRENALTMRLTLENLTDAGGRTSGERL